VAPAFGGINHNSSSCKDAKALWAREARLKAAKGFKGNELLLLDANTSLANLRLCVCAGNAISPHGFMPSKTSIVSGEP
jgi:hypothetical protein